MRIKIEEIREKILPFVLLEYDDEISFSLSAGNYKDKIFEIRLDEGFNGSGYDWNALARVFLNEQMPQFIDEIKFDSESSMFCTYSKNKGAILEFAIHFHMMCENEKLMKELFSRAELE